MFEVIFEVHPQHWEGYLALAKSLRSDLEAQRGFVANVRYKSLTRPGWVLSLSDWSDEKALVRWRTQAKHHGAQEKGRNDIFADYHLRIGEVTEDNGEGAVPVQTQQRLDETVAGRAKVIVLMNVRLSPLEGDIVRDAGEVCKRLGFDAQDLAGGLVSWDAFEAILAPGDVLLLAAFTDQASAATCAKRVAVTESVRVRHVRVIRDYGMFDREEAPQYYPEVNRE